MQATALCRTVTKTVQNPASMLLTTKKYSALDVFEQRCPRYDDLHLFVGTLSICEQWITLGYPRSLNLITHPKGMGRTL
jgi:hypothetical protein